MNDIQKAAIVTVSIAVLTVLTARCAMIGDEVSAHASEEVRITAPQASIYIDGHIRADQIARGEVHSAKAHGEVIEITEIKEAAEPIKTYTPAYVLMDGVPLGADVQLAIEQMCADRDIDVAVVLAMIECESGYDEMACGDGGNSIGLMQIQERWHYERMARLGVTDLYDGVGNVTVGIDYLDECLDRCGGDYAAALTMYNRGHFDGEVNYYAQAILNAVHGGER